MERFPIHAAPVGQRSAAARGRLPAFLSALAIGISALSGCGGGGGGGSSPASNELNGTASDVAVTDLGGQRIQVAFTLRTPQPKDLGVTIEFSQDRGMTFAAASTEAAAQPGAGAPSSLPADPGGVRSTVVWNASRDLSNSNQHDLCLRVIPFDASTNQRGIAASSPVFGMGANTPPVLSSLSTPTGLHGGWVSFTYSVADADGDHVGIEGEFSLDGGATFATATLGQGDGAVMVDAPSGGASHSISWNAQTDAGSRTGSQVRLRLRAVDTEEGAFVESADFSIDTRPPAIDLVTIDGIPAEMNGTVPFTNSSGQPQTFHLLAPPVGFVVWISWSGGASGVDAGTLSVTSSTAIGGGPPSGLAAGQNFGGRFSVDAGSGVAQLVVGSDLAFPPGDTTLTATVSDVLGNSSAPVSFTFSSAPPPPQVLPFRQTDRWWIDFGRDNWTIGSSTDGQGTVTVNAVSGSNGTADIIEDLRILGLQSASPPPAAQSANLNGVVLAAIEEAVLGRLNELYGRNFDGSSAGAGSVDILFSLSPPGGSYSRISVGGDDPIPGYTIGRAEFDYRNAGPNDDSATDLGVFVTNLIDFYINASFTFRTRFNPLIPGRGVPLGFDANDVTVLDPSFDRGDPSNTSQENTRFDQIAAAIDAIARSTATILAHEIGHSVGLVANGAPTAGLFGGEAQASFSGPYTTSYHLDTGDNEVMAASLSFSDCIITGPGGPRFHPLLLSYLQQRIILE